MTDKTLDNLEIGNSLGVGSSGEVFEVVGHESDLVVKRFNSLAIDRSFLQRNFARLQAMPDFHGTPRVIQHRLDRPPYAV